MFYFQRESFEKCRRERNYFRNKVLELEVLLIKAEEEEMFAQQVYQDSAGWKEETERYTEHLHDLLREKDEELFRVEQNLETERLKTTAFMHNEKDTLSAGQELGEAQQRIALLETMVEEQKQAMEKASKEAEKIAFNSVQELSDAHQKTVLLESMVGEQKLEMEKAQRQHAIEKENLISSIQSHILKEQEENATLLQKCYLEEQKATKLEKLVQKEQDESAMLLQKYNLEEQKSAELEKVVEKQKEKLELLFKEMVSTNRVNTEKISNLKDLLVRMGDAHNVLKQNCDKCLVCSRKNVWKAASRVE